MNKAELYKLLNQLDQELPKKEYEGNIVFDYKNSSTEIGLFGRENATSKTFS